MLSILVLGTLLVLDHLTLAILQWPLLRCLDLVPVPAPVLALQRSPMVQVRPILLLSAIQALVRALVRALAQGLHAAWGTAPDLASALAPRCHKNLQAARAGVRVRGPARHRHPNQTS